MYRILNGLMVALLFGGAATLPTRLRAQAGAPPMSAPSVNAPSMITASGHGESTVPPDRATVMISVESHASTASAAASDNAKRTRATLDTLRVIGLTRDELSTTGYSVQPDYRYDKGVSEVVGYIARNTIRAEVRKLDQTGRVIDAALAGGAISIGNVDFAASTMDDARRTALTAAVEQARGDAEAMAKAAGGSLGVLIELSSDVSMPGPRPVFMGRALALNAASAPTQLEPGDLTVDVTVTARWQFTASATH